MGGGGACPRLGHWERSSRSPDKVGSVTSKLNVHKNWTFLLSFQFTKNVDSLSGVILARSVSKIGNSLTNYAIQLNYKRRAACCSLCYFTFTNFVIALGNRCSWNTEIWQLRHPTGTWISDSIWTMLYHSDWLKWSHDLKKRMRMLKLQCRVCWGLNI